MYRLTEFDFDIYRSRKPKQFVVDRLAEYENLGSVEDFKHLKHELEVYKRALKLVLTRVAEDNDMEFNEHEDIKFVLEEARKELEDEKNKN